VIVSSEHQKYIYKSLRITCLLSNETEV